MARLISSVKRLWTTKPLLVNCITYGTLYGAAELSQQCLIRKVFVSLYFTKNGKEEIILVLNNINYCNILKYKYNRGNVSDKSMFFFFIQAENPEDLDLPLVGRYVVLGSTAFPTFLFFW